MAVWEISKQIIHIGGRRRPLEYKMSTGLVCSHDSIYSVLIVIILENVLSVKQRAAAGESNLKKWLKCQRVWSSVVAAVTVVYRGCN